MNYSNRMDKEEKEILQKHSKSINSFILYCNTLDIQLTLKNIKYYQSVGVVAEYPKILFHLNNELKEDKEGLLNFNNISHQFKSEMIIPGYLSSDLYMAMAHSYFRKNYNIYNNFVPQFIEKYWSQFPKDLKKYIALDFDRVKINKDISETLEFDTWFGAKFEKSIVSIPNGLIKLKPPLELSPLHIKMLYKNSYSLDIKWYTKNNIKVFQAEEFKTEQILITEKNNLYHPTKYIHAEYDMKKNCFRHFDGAIHLYEHEDYMIRRESDFNFNIKNGSHIKPKSRKLFKLNGDLDVSKWIDLTSHFYNDSPLIIEYFEGKLSNKILKLVNKIRNN